MDFKRFVEEKLNTKVSSVTKINGGMMNESFLFTTPLGKYVGYFPPEHVAGMVDRKLEKFHLDLAGRNNLTNENAYFDVESGIKINKYIDGSSLNHTSSYDIKKVAKLMKSFHSLNPLSGVEYAPFERLKDYQNEAAKYQQLSTDYITLRNFLFANMDLIKNDKQVISHNDAQKSNILKSVDDEYFLIDFEFAADNDEYYDIATFGNDHVEEGVQLLYAYLNGNVENDDLKKYYFWRIFVSLQWHLVAISKHYKGEGAIHNFNFLDVAEHFMNNAKEAYQKMNQLMQA